MSPNHVILVWLVTLPRYSDETEQETLVAVYTNHAAANAHVRRGNYGHPTGQYYRKEVWGLQTHAPEVVR